MLPLGHATIPALLDFMPARISLRFIAYHGDPAYLPYSVAQLSHRDSSRYAGWVWQTITGVNLESAGLCLPEPPLSADDAGISDARVDADHGLPLPDMNKIARFPTASLPIGQRCLLGQILTPQLALEVLETAPRAQRNIASHFLLHFHTHLRLNPRGHVARQLSTMRQLRHMLINEGTK